MSPGQHCSGNADSTLLKADQILTRTAYPPIPLDRARRNQQEWILDERQTIPLLHTGRRFLSCSRSPDERVDRDPLLVGYPGSPSDDAGSNCLLPLAQMHRLDGHLSE